MGSALRVAQGGSPRSSVSEAKRRGRLDTEDARAGTEGCGRQVLPWRFAGCRSRARRLGSGGEVSWCSGYFEPVD